MTTSVPNSPQELLNLNTELTPEELFDKWCELPYEDQDNFIFKLLVCQLKFHKFLLDKSQKGDSDLPDTQQLMRDVTKLEVIIRLYEEVE